MMYIESRICIFRFVGYDMAKGKHISREITSIVYETSYGASKCRTSIIWF